MSSHNTCKPTLLEGLENRKRPSPLPAVEASDHHGVPQRVHLAAAVVHDSGQPGVDGLGTVAVTVTQQLLVDAEGDRNQRQSSSGPIHQPSNTYSVNLHHLLNDVFEMLVVSVIS